MRTTARCLCVFLLLSTACRAAGEEPGAPPAAPPPPGSALVAVVRALETVHALRPAGTRTQVRAITCDTRLDPERALEFERVFLDVTVFAPSQAEAVEAFAALRAALEAEARAEARVEQASADRVRNALEQVAVGSDEGPELLSYSDRIRLEVRPGSSPAVQPAAAGRASGAVDTLLDYVHERATRAGAVGGIALRPAPHRRGGLRCELRPAEPSERFTLGQIALFLASLEQDSPGLRLTRIAIEPSQHEPDPASPSRWTFEAELCLLALAD